MVLVIGLVELHRCRLDIGITVEAADEDRLLLGHLAGLGLGQQRDAVLIGLIVRGDGQDAAVLQPPEALYIAAVDIAVQPAEQLRGCLGLQIILVHPAAVLGQEILLDAGHQLIVVAAEEILIGIAGLIAVKVDVAQGGAAIAAVIADIHLAVLASAHGPDPVDVGSQGHCPTFVPIRVEQPDIGLPRHIDPSITVDGDGIRIAVGHQIRHVLREYLLAIGIELAQERLGLGVVLIIDIGDAVHAAVLGKGHAVQVPVLLLCVR